MEVIQTLILIILWLVAFRKGSPPTGFEWFILLIAIVWYVSSCSYVISLDDRLHHLRHSLIGVAIYKCYYHLPDALLKRTSTSPTTLQVQPVDDLDRDSECQIVKVTGFRLFCTVLPLGLTIAKYVLSAGNNSVSSNNLDLVGYVVGSIVCVFLKILKAEIQRILIVDSTF